MMLKRTVFFCYMHNVIETPVYMCCFSLPFPPCTSSMHFLHALPTQPVYVYCLPPPVAILI